MLGFWQAGKPHVHLFQDGLGQLTDSSAFATGASGFPNRLVLDDGGVVCQMRLFSKVDPICTRLCEKKRSLHVHPK